MVTLTRCPSPCPPTPETPRGGTNPKFIHHSQGQSSRGRAASSSSFIMAPGKSITKSTSKPAVASTSKNGKTVSSTTCGKNAVPTTTKTSQTTPNNNNMQLLRRPTAPASTSARGSNQVVAPATQNRSTPRGRATTAPAVSAKSSEAASKKPSIHLNLNIQMNQNGQPVVSNGAPGNSSRQPGNPIAVSGTSSRVPANTGLATNRSARPSGANNGSALNTAPIRPTDPKKHSHNDQNIPKNRTSGRQNSSNDRQPGLATISGNNQNAWRGDSIRTNLDRNDGINRNPVSDEVRSMGQSRNPNLSSRVNNVLNWDYSRLRETRIFTMMEARALFFEAVRQERELGMNPWDVNNLHQRLEDTGRVVEVDETQPWTRLYQAHISNLVAVGTLFKTAQVQNSNIGVRIYSISPSGTLTFFVLDLHLLYHYGRTVWDVDMPMDKGTIFHSLTSLAHAVGMNPHDLHIGPRETPFREEQFYA